jgi:hypothetical protein
MEDSTPTGYHKLDLQFTSRYDRTHENRDRFTLQPQVKYGIAHDWDLHVRSPLILGNDSRTGSGDVQVNAQWNFLKERSGGWWPALAIQGQIEAPSGEHSAGVDPSVKFIATKTLTEAWSRDELHVNVNWTYNAGPLSTERHGYAFALAGYSRRIAEDTILVADYVWEQQQRRGKDWHTVEIGIMQKLTEKVKLGVSLGTGIGEDSPRLLATFGLSHSL